MDDMPRAVDEDLLKNLECPVCMEYMVPPIKLCTNGHNICSSCTERVSCCPTCRAEFSETRCVALENIVRRQKYPCDNRQSGCLAVFLIEHIFEHHAVCVYGKIKCPMHLLKMCSWNGLKNDLKEHAKAAHPSTFLEVSTFISPYLLAALGILSCFGQLFTYYKQTRGGRLYAAVQLIGTSSETSKYKCEFTLRAANGIEQISNTFFVRGYSEDFETIFNSVKCLKLDRDTIKHFVKENKLKLTVTLSTV
jgi:E3 ubiquitin-protein ligase SIAH1